MENEGATFGLGRKVEQLVDPKLLQRLMSKASKIYGWVLMVRGANHCHPLGANP